MKVWELAAWLDKQDQMAEIRICTDPESGKYIAFEANDHAVIDKDNRKITIFNF